mmetsp:Transcript_46906/g.92327  ORF Transcript_46906/g.92327 Transcript_46906/m.92327 type:complete len:143 (+) Transcript_46906:53-481(+)
MSNQFRVLGVVLNSKARIHHALQGLYGVGPHQANSILAAVGVHPDTRTEKLGNDMDVFRSHIEKHYLTKPQLERKQAEDIKMKIKIGSYQGQRHMYGLPVHGQRRKSNHKSQRRMAAWRHKFWNIPLAKERASDRNNRRKKS